MRAQPQARHLCLTVRTPAAPRSKHRGSLRQRSSYTPANPPSVTIAIRRAVRVDDRELFRRVRRVQRWQDLSRNSEDHTATRLIDQGWRWRSHKNGFELYTRQSPMIGATGSPLGALNLPSLQDSEVLAIGNVVGSVAQLASPLCSSSESDYNSLMRKLYGSDFIYGSLVHKATIRRRSRSRADSVGTVQERESARQGDDQTSQLLVKTSSFVHTSMFDKKNEQLCHVELFTPTTSGGFSIAACSLPGRDVVTGKARTPVRRSLHQLHPYSAWLSAEPVDTGVHIVYRARFHRCESDGSCSPKVMTARMWRLAKGVCRLGKLVDATTQQPRALTKMAPRNSRCIVCTRSLFHIFMARSYSCCELCSYNVCSACCSRQNVAIYNRHVAPLLVCARCRESLDRDEFDSQLRAVSSR